MQMLGGREGGTGADEGYSRGGDAGEAPAPRAAAPRAPAARPAAAARPAPAPRPATGFDDMDDDIPF